MSEPHLTTEADTTSDQEAARVALPHLQIVNVHPVSLSARLVGDTGGDPQGARYQVELEYRSAPGLFENQIKYRIEILNSDEDVLAELEFSLSVEYSVDHEYEVPENAADYITRTTSYFGAYPYARELAQMLATRLQISPIVLGLLHHGSLDPTGIAMVSLERNPQPTEN